MTHTECCLASTWWLCGCWDPLLRAAVGTACVCVWGGGACWVLVLLHGLRWPPVVSCRRMKGHGRGRGHWHVDLKCGAVAAAFVGQPRVCALCRVKRPQPGRYKHAPAKGGPGPWAPGCCYIATAGSGGAGTNVQTVSGARATRDYALDASGASLAALSVDAVVVGSSAGAASYPGRK